MVSRRVDGEDRQRLDNRNRLLLCEPNCLATQRSGRYKSLVPIRKWSSPLLWAHGIVTSVGGSPVSSWTFFALSVGDLTKGCYKSAALMIMIVWPPSCTFVANNCNSLPEDGYLMSPNRAGDDDGQQIPRDNWGVLSNLPFSRWTSESRFQERIGTLLTANCLCLSSCWRQRITSLINLWYSPNWRHSMAQEEWRKYCQHEI